MRTCERRATRAALRALWAIVKTPMPDRARSVLLFFYEARDFIDGPALKQWYSYGSLGLASEDSMWIPFKHDAESMGKDRVDEVPQ